MNPSTVNTPAFLFLFSPELLEFSDVYTCKLGYTLRGNKMRHITCRSGAETTRNELQLRCVKKRLRLRSQ